MRRLRRNVREHGVGGTIRRVGWAAGRTYRWYCLELRSVVDFPLPQGLELRAAGFDDVDVYSHLTRLGPNLVRARIDAGGRLYIAFDGEQPAFACWIFSHRTPFGEAPDGWLELPAGTACLEDSVTAPDHRGGGIAPAVWSAIARRLETEEMDRLLTKVREDNVATQRALAKVGFVALKPDDEFRCHLARQIRG